MQKSFFVRILEILKKDQFFFLFENEKQYLVGIAEERSNTDTVKKDAYMDDTVPKLNC